MKKFGKIFGFSLLSMLFVVSLAVADDDDDEVTVKGPIQSFSDTQITVEGTTFIIDDDTEFEHGSAADMAVGVWVKVKGEVDEHDGLLYAEEIKFEEDEDDDDHGDDHDHGKKIKKTGYITNINADTIEVDGTVFSTDENTRYKHTTRSDLQVGDRVKVKAYLQDDGSYWAKEVKLKEEDDDDDDGDDDDDDGDDHSGKKSSDAGIVSDVGATGFELNGVTYLFGDSTKFIVKSFEGDFDPALFEDGLMVRVTYVLDGDGNRVALKIYIYLPKFNYCGEIEALSADSMTVMDVEFAVGDWTEFEDDMTFADYAVGDFVEIEGLVWPDDTMVATEVEPCDDDDFDVKGEILAVTTDSATGLTIINVGGVQVLVTPLTRFKDGNSGDLVEGTEVQVSGDQYDDGILLAKKIRIR